jgi:hypothetical protein
MERDSTRKPPSFRYSTLAMSRRVMAGGASGNWKRAAASARQDSTSGSAGGSAASGTWASGVGDFFLIVPHPKRRETRDHQEEERSEDGKGGDCVRFHGTPCRSVFEEA